MTNNKINDSVPQIRFPEFMDEWREAKFKDIFCRVTSKNKENNQNILTISAQYGLVSQDEFFSKIVAAKNVQGYYLLHKNDYAYNKSYSKGYPVGAIKRLAQDKGVVSTLYICFSLRQPGSEVFFDQYFESGKHNREIQKIAQEGARNHGLLNMSIDDFFSTKLIVPSAAEQQKIAEFLAAVDKRVALLECKVQQLEVYKRGVMQQLFSQQLRFTRPDGSRFPVWQEKRLGEVFDAARGSSLSWGDIEADGKNKAILYGQLYTIYPEVVSQVVSRTNSNKGTPSKKGDLLLPNSTTTTGIDLANATALNEDGVLLGGDITILRFKETGSNIFYAYYLSHFMKYKLAAYGQGSTIVHMYFSQYKNMKIVEPSAAEQQKIAAFLSVLDEKITLTRQQLDKTKQFKKGLLQRMFV